jgi:hypothetical protein
MNSIFNVFRISLAQLWLLGILVVSAFVLGAFARPGFDLGAELVGAVISPKPVQHISPKTDFEVAVDTYFSSEQHQARCMAMATEQVAVDWAGKYLEIAKTTGEKVRVYEFKAVNQVSESTATETVRLEKAAGRGK